jgi:hypothetical protein
VVEGLDAISGWWPGVRGRVPFQYPIGQVLASMEVWNGVF